MQYTITQDLPQKQSTSAQCILVGVYENAELTPSAEQIDRSTKKIITTCFKQGDFKGESGETHVLYQLPGFSCERVLLIGCGKKHEIFPHHFDKIMTSAFTTLNKLGAKIATSYLTEIAVRNVDTAWKIRQMIAANAQARYRFTQLKSHKPTSEPALKKLVLALDNTVDTQLIKKVIAQSQAIANGVHLCKDLGNLAPNICTPTYLATKAKQLAKQYKTIKTTVLEETDMEKLGMGSLLSVTKGSTEPGKLITLEYSGTTKTKQPVVLVGKGITFDSGGISLKPGANMDEMKFDMCGAASVLGTLQTVAELGLPINVVGVIPTCENLPDGKASKPGDIVTSMSGQTIEILNTDAEGRLILCDALTYCEKFKPAVVIDIATLTGAVIIALGNHPMGLLSNDQALADQLIKASTESHDRVWQLPLWEEYQSQLDSNFADMANVGGREAGTIVAACFLSRFTKKYRWAHLDIAGVAWKTGKQKGATGRPVPLLTQFLINYVGQK